jgi:hypothetical protein
MDQKSTGVSIFVSFQDNDYLRAADPLVKHLKSHGFTVFSFRHKETQSADYHVEVDTSLDQSDFVVVLWSAHAKKSHWVEREITAARYKGKHFILVLLDSTISPDPLIARADGIRAFDDPFGWPAQVAEQIKVRTLYPLADPMPYLPGHAPQWLRFARNAFVVGMAIVAGIQGMKSTGYSVKKLED